MNARWDLVSISFVDFFSISPNIFHTLPLINFVMTFDIQRVAKLLKCSILNSNISVKNSSQIIRETENL